MQAVESQICACPRCGGTGEWVLSGRVERYGQQGNIFRFGYYQCQSCKMRTTESSTKKRAAQSWQEDKLFSEADIASGGKRHQRCVIGARFGSLTVVERIGAFNQNWRQQSYVCRCDCGNLCEYTGNHLYTFKGDIDCGCSGRLTKRSTKTASVDGVPAERCPHNSGVLCASGDCERCGWNPAVERVRKQRLRYGRMCK